MPDLNRLGKYEILEEIGRGGFAVVYKARDPKLGQVAIKVLHSAHTEQHTIVRRFLDEASKVFQLRHRGIVRLYAVDEDKGMPYIAMDYLPGGTLAERLRGEPLPLDGAIAIVEQVAAALDHAHKRELVHRDVKPANILFDEEGQAVLVDFGLVKSLAESGLTIEGTLMGTPAYMAPEQADTAARVDTRADVYALGIVAYEMLTGRVPFEADTPLTVLYAQTHKPPPDLCAINEKLDKNVAAVVLKALEKEPTKRYQSTGAFARALRKAWKAIQNAAQARDTLADLYTQVQEAMKAGQWGAVASLCIVIRNIDPDYRDVGALLTLAASRLIEEEQKRKQEQEWQEQYVAALELLEKREYAKVIEALEEIAAQAPDFRDVEARLEQARTEQEKEQLYEVTRKMLADKCYDEACTNLLALLRLNPDHVDARVRLLEAAEGLLAQLRDVQIALKIAQVQVDAYDNLLLAMEDRDREQMVMLTEKLAEAKLSGVSRLLLRLQAVMEEQEAIKSGDCLVSRVDGKKMVHVATGKFLYGDEKKERELSEFWIDKTPVTNAEYARFVEATGHDLPSHWEGKKTPPKKIADHPVSYVSWHDATAYAEWAGKRLPSEEEWEKAARGTGGWEYPWGDWAEGRCNTEESGNGDTTPVGQYSPDGDSPYGCVDMAGNVWEWTESKQSRGSDIYVFCGGSWRSNKGDARCATRLDIYVARRSHGPNGGFRCVSPVSLL